MRNDWIFKVVQGENEYLIFEDGSVSGFDCGTSPFIVVNKIPMRIRMFHEDFRQNQETIEACP